jgi:hypothetical protein
MAVERCLSISFQIIEISMLKPFLGYKSGFGFDTLTFKNKNPVKVYDTLKSRIDKSVWGAIL